MISSKFFNLLIFIVKKNLSMKTKDTIEPNILDYPCGTCRIIQYLEFNYYLII